MSIKLLEDINNALCMEKQKYALANLEDIELDVNNPRFASSTVLDSEQSINEQHIISYLAQFGNLTEIMNNIIKNNGLYWEEFLSCIKSSTGKLIVLEGNRRISACKALNNLNLLPEEYRADINLKADMTQLLNSLSTIRVLIYTDADDAQSYISAKHTKPEVKKWETYEQCNYYYSQFKNGSGTSIYDISLRAHEKQKDVIKDIKRFSIFKNVFDATKKMHPNLLIEGKSILPLVDKFMPVLIGKKQYGLNLTCDESTLLYSPSPLCTDIYIQILYLIGEAFFVRKKAKPSEIEERNTSSIYRISTDEIKNQRKVISLIEDDIRIPGLKNLIATYINLSQNKIGNDDSAQEASATEESAGEKSSSSDSEKQTASTKAENAGTNNSSSTVTQNKPQKEHEFFEDLDYSTLNPQSADDLGLYRVCKEIVKISNYNSNAGYKNFPIASTFLLRSLIEQTLTRQLKKTGHYNKLINNNNSTKTPELGKMIEYILKQCNNGNSSPLNNDPNLVKLFNQTFTGQGTHDQLNMVIHQPHMIEPEQNFLNALSKQGIKSIIQTIISNLYVQNEADS